MPYLVSLFLLIAFSSHAETTKCHPSVFDLEIQLKEVVDGDTIRLEDNSLVRLIGINSPEINHKKPELSKAFSHRAKEHLQQLLVNSDTVFIKFDKEFVDKYNRMLAHVFTQQGHNIQAQMLESGLASHWVIGKNDLFWQCYQQNELFARNNTLGIWSHIDWEPKPALKTKQWHDKSYEFSGNLSHHWLSKKGTHWLVLEDHLYLGIDLENQDKFKNRLKVNIKKNEKLIVRGRPYFHDKHWRIKLKHPWQLIRQHQIKK